MPGPKEVLLVEPLNWQEEGRGDGKRHSDEVSGGWQTGLRRTLPLRQFRPRPVLFSCNDVSVCVCVWGGVALMVPAQSFGDWVETDLPRQI